MVFLVMCNWPLKISPWSCWKQRQKINKVTHIFFLLIPFIIRHSIHTERGTNLKCYNSKRSDQCIHWRNPTSQSRWRTKPSLKKSSLCPFPVSSSLLLWFLSKWIHLFKTSYKWDHAVCTLLVSLPRCNVLELNAQCCVYRWFVHLHCWVVFRRLKIPHF